MPGQLLSTRPLPPDDGIDCKAVTRRGHILTHKRLDSPAEVDLGAIEAVIAEAFVAGTMSPEAYERERQHREALGIPAGAVYALPPAKSEKALRGAAGGRKHRKKPRGSPSTRVPGTGTHAWRRCGCGKATRGQSRPCLHCGRLPARRPAA